MRRALALPLAAALLSIPAAARASEPLDLDLYRLGAPRSETWVVYGVADPTATAQAMDARRRFATLSAETALAFTSALLDTAATTGHSGFDVGFESAYVGVDPRKIGSDQPLPATGGTYAATGPWVTNTLTPYELYVPSFHVRKALPFSLEAGGRILYLSQSSYGAAQLEGKWALNEGFEYLPDLAVHVAHTMVFGQKDWNLGATSVDFIVSKRYGVNGVVKFAPYAAARFLYVRASTDTMYWGGNAPAASPSDPNLYGAFPTLSALLYRTTVGLRLTTYAVSLAAEGTYFGGATVGGDAAYPKQKLKSSWGSAVRFGFEF